MINRVAAAVLAMAGGAAADVWSPLDFFSKGNPKQGATQDDAAQWTFRRDAYDGMLLTGLRDKQPCEPGFGLWGRPDDPYYGYLPCVGPRVSPNENRDHGTEASIPEFEGLLVIPTPADHTFLVFTAGGPVTVPKLTLLGEMLYLDYGDGVRITVKTMIGGKTVTRLDAGLVPPVIDGFQQWILFDKDHPQMQAGDKLWIEVDPNQNLSADWLNLSLTSDECYPDCTGDGTLDLFDFLCFVNGFNAGDAGADCDGNGGLDLFDFLCFVNAFNAGC